MKTQIQANSYCKRPLFYKISRRPEIFHPTFTNNTAKEKLKTKQNKKCSAGFTKIKRGSGRTTEIHGASILLALLESLRVPGSNPGTTSWRRWSSWRRSPWSWSPAARPWPRPPACRFQTPQRRCRVSRGRDAPLWSRETCRRRRRRGKYPHTHTDSETERWRQTHWLNSMDSIISLVSSGRLLRNRM